MFYRRLILLCVVLEITLVVVTAQAVSPPVTHIYIPAMDLTAEVLAVEGQWAEADFSNDAWTLGSIGDQVGWLDPAGGPPQSGPGNIVLAGHYTVPPSGVPGAFFNLAKLGYGDFVYTLQPDGSTQAYRVIETSIVDDNDMSVVWDTGDGRLTLISCTGEGYSHRQVVVAEPLSSVTCVEPGVGGQIVPCIE